MTTPSGDSHERAPGPAKGGSRPSLASARSDAILIAFASALVGGVYLVLWADAHRLLTETAFTPWHAPAYLALIGSLLFIVLSVDGGMRHGRRWRSSLPRGYGMALLGLGLLALYPVLDVVWAATVDRQAGIGGALRPSSLLIPAGLVLVVVGPLRSAGERRMVPDGRRYARSALPSVVASGLLLASLSIPLLPLSPLAAVPAGSIGTAADTPWEEITRADHSWSGVRTISLDRKTQIRLTVGNQGQEAAWSPNGKRIVYAEGGDVTLMRANGTGRLKLPDVTGQEGWFTWSPDSTRIAYMASPPRDPSASDPPGDAPTPAPGQFGPLSPDGLEGGGTTPGLRIGGEWDLWMLPLDGSDPIRLTDEAGLDGGPTWSTDGREIAFHSERTGDDEIWAMPADGGPARQLTHDPAADFAPSWSPDGARIAFASDRGGDYELYSIATDGTDVRQLTDSPGQAFQPGWSPDGRILSFLCYGAEPTAVGEVCTKDLTTGAVTQYTDDARYANYLSDEPWSADGTTLVYSSRRLTPVELAETAADLGLDDAFDVARLLLAVALLAGVLLLAWHLGLWVVGTSSVVLIAPLTLAAVVLDAVRFIPAIVIAAVVVEFATRAFRPWEGARGRMAGIAVVATAAWIVAYLLTLAISGDLRWSPELTVGVAIACGAVGLLPAQLILTPGGTETE